LPHRRAFLCHMGGTAHSHCALAEVMHVPATRGATSCRFVAAIEPSVGSSSQSATYRKRHRFMSFVYNHCLADYTDAPSLCDPSQRLRDESCRRYHATKSLIRTQLNMPLQPQILFHFNNGI
jgi:hypothetical protein